VSGKEEGRGFTHLAPFEESKGGGVRENSLPSPFPEGSKKGGRKKQISLPLIEQWGEQGKSLSYPLEKGGKEEGKKGKQPGRGVPRNRRKKKRLEILWEKGKEGARWGGGGREQKRHSSPPGEERRKKTCVVVCVEMAIGEKKGRSSIYPSWGEKGGGGNL